MKDEVIFPFDRGTACSIKPEKKKYMSLSMIMHWNRITHDTENSLLEDFKSRLDPFMEIGFNQKVHHWRKLDEISLLLL